MIKSLKQEKEYKIGSFIGKGGLGTVYHATLCGEFEFSKNVAIKFISSAQNKNDLLGFSETEAYVAGKLNHPNIVEIYDVGKYPDGIYVAMEYVDGFPLDKLLRLLNKPVPTKIAMMIIKKIALALHYLHTECLHEENKVLLHCDISSQNIILRLDQMIPKLNDFGSSKIVKPGKKAHTDVGNPFYISPEQSFGDGIDETSDIYSLGVVFYDLLTNCRTYNHSLEEIAQLANDGNSIDRNKLGVQLSDAREIALKMLEIDPKNRFQKALQVAEALDRCLGHNEIDDPDVVKFIETTKHLKLSPEIDHIEKSENLLPNHARTLIIPRDKKRTVNTTAKQERQKEEKPVHQTAPVHPVNSTVNRSKLINKTKRKNKHIPKFAAGLAAIAAIGFVLIYFLSNQTSGKTQTETKTELVCDGSGECRTKEVKNTDGMVNNPQESVPEQANVDNISANESKEAVTDNGDSGGVKSEMNLTEHLVPLTFIPNRYVKVELFKKEGQKMTKIKEQSSRQLEVSLSEGQYVIQMLHPYRDLGVLGKYFVRVFQDGSEMKLEYWQEGSKERVTRTFDPEKSQTVEIKHDLNL